jgi:hypothetical protein
MQISQGKFDLFPHILAGSTTSVFDDYALRNHLLARATEYASVSGSCSSSREFAPRFLQTLPRDFALARC